MKKLLVFVLPLLFAVSCSRPADETPSRAEWIYNSVVYEMNVRQLTPEGTFRAAAGELPMLKEIGVDIVWLMPVHPIGVLERKGTLGSYYAPKNYKEVNPEFGTLEDFDFFLKTAHDLGLKVILDWVANHTSPDSEWAVSHPDWFRHDAEGKFVVQYDWTDIAPLDLSNQEMRDCMRDCLRFWLERGVDGFRCDVAGEMPFEYWESMIIPLRKEYPQMYWLAEGEHPEHHTISGFDASYSWKLHHLMNDIAQGKAAGHLIGKYVEENAAAYPADALRLAFTSNHDENAWAGTEFERMGNAWKAMTVLCWTLPGVQPLIYTGQEVGMDHRFLFFEKDPMPSRQWNEYTDFYKYLSDIKKNNPALRAGDSSCTYGVLGSDDDHIEFVRRCGTNSVTVRVDLKEPWEYNITCANE